MGAKKDAKLDRKQLAWANETLEYLQRMVEDNNGTGHLAGHFATIEQVIVELGNFVADNRSLSEAERERWEDVQSDAIQVLHAKGLPFVEPLHAEY